MPKPNGPPSVHERDQYVRACVRFILDNERVHDAIAERFAAPQVAAADGPAHQDTIHSGPRSRD